MKEEVSFSEFFSLKTFCVQVLSFLRFKHTAQKISYEGFIKIFCEDGRVRTHDLRGYALTTRFCLTDWLPPVTQFLGWSRHRKRYLGFVSYTVHFTSHKLFRFFLQILLFHKYQDFLRRKSVHSKSDGNRLELWNSPLSLLGPDQKSGFVVFNQEYCWNTEEQLAFTSDDWLSWLL